MLYYFKKSKITTETQNKFCTVYGEGAVTDWMCQKWFKKFHVGYFLLDGVPRSGKAVEVDSDQIKTLTEGNQCYPMQEIADILKISKPNIENHLHSSFMQLIYVIHSDVWVPHKLSKKKKKIFLTVFPHVIIYLNIMKMFRFETNCAKWWKVNAVWYCGMEEIMGQAKWTTANNIKGQS